MARTNKQTKSATKGLAGARKAASPGRALTKSRKGATRKAADAGPPAEEAGAAPDRETARKTAGERARDPRLPAAGSTITREYKGREIRVTVLDAGFRCEGKEYRSLTALALAITGYPAISGPAFFRLTGAGPATKSALARGTAPAQDPKPRGGARRASGPKGAATGPERPGQRELTGEPGAAGAAPESAAAAERAAGEDRHAG